MPTPADIVHICYWSNNRIKTATIQDTDEYSRYKKAGMHRLLNYDQSMFINNIKLVIDSLETLPGKTIKRKWGG